MDVDENEPAMALLDTGKDTVQLTVEGVVKGERRRNDVLVRLLSPDFQAPGLVRRPLDRSRARAVQIDLKARSMHDDLGWEISDEVFGERILLPLPVGVGEAHERFTGTPDVGAAVDRCANNGGIPELDCPACR